MCEKPLCHPLTEFADITEVEKRTGSHNQQLSEILDAMESNTRPPVSGDEARRILEFNASLYKSACSGQIVTRVSITPADSFYYSNNGNPEMMEKQKS